jgi:predicted metal-dependent phosphoesterase TrpH
MTNLLDTNISVFSITDHDTIENSTRMLHKVAEYHAYQGQYVIGVEVSCTYLDKWYHVTAYAFDPYHEALLNLLETNRRRMHEHNDTTIKLLENHHPNIDYTKYKEYHHDRKRGGWKSLNFLLDEGIIHKLSEYFQLTKDLDNKVVFSDPLRVITTIREAGGFSFLAHPNAYFQGKKMPVEELQKWVALGISGIECYSSYCSIQEAQEYAEFCCHNNLFISAGSDCHGTFLPKKLGNPKVTLDMLNVEFIGG